MEKFSQKAKHAENSPQIILPEHLRAKNRVGKDNARQSYKNSVESLQRKISPKKIYPRKFPSQRKILPVKTHLKQKIPLSKFLTAKT